jgi:hypothetical protein
MTKVLDHVLAANQSNAETFGDESRHAARSPFFNPDLHGCTA